MAAGLMLGPWVSRMADAADSGDLMSEFPALRLDEKLGPLPELAERRLAVTGGSVKTEAGDG